MFVSSPVSSSYVPMTIQNRLNHSYCTHVPRISSHPSRHQKVFQLSPVRGRCHRCSSGHPPVPSAGLTWLLLRGRVLERCWCLWAQQLVRWITMRRSNEMVGMGNSHRKRAMAKCRLMSIITHNIINLEVQPTKGTCITIMWYILYQIPTILLITRLHSSTVNPMIFFQRFLLEGLGSSGWCRFVDGDGGLVV